jgi:hypothetical protein
VALSGEVRAGGDATALALDSGVGRDAAAAGTAGIARSAALAVGVFDGRGDAAAARGAAAGRA